MDSILKTINSKLQQFIHVLQDEHESLEKPDINDVQSSTEKKQALITEIEQSTLKLNKLLDQHQLPHALESIQKIISSYPKNEQPQLEQQLATLKDLSSKSQTLNQTNGAIISANLGKTHRKLDILSMAIGISQTVTYNESGKTQRTHSRFSSKA